MGKAEYYERQEKDLKHFMELEVYQRAFAAAMRIFEVTKTFPGEEKFWFIRLKRTCM